MGYALSPSQLFHTLAERGRQNQFILDDLAETLRAIERSTLGAESEDDFANLFEDLDINSTKLGNNANDRNELISKVLTHLDNIDFDLSNSESDVLGDAYEYLIGEFASGAGKKQANSIPLKLYLLSLPKLSHKAKSVLYMIRPVVQVLCYYVLNVKSKT